MRIGIVCPYSFAVPGGVQSHVMDLARALQRGDHEVKVLAPGADGSETPDFVRSTGRSVGIPYNGSVARLSFGPKSYLRVRRWLREHDFDVLHLHEPAAPSLSLLALLLADCPVVATFHTATKRSKALSAGQILLQPFLEKITARIVVSELARRVQVEHLGANGVQIPNGVDVGFFADAAPLTGYPRTGSTVGFVGRFTEPRKGMLVLLAAIRQLLGELPELQLLVVGRGDAEALRREAGPAVADRIVLLGQADDVTKAQALRSVDVYCAPNIGGESFGVILLEALAAGTPVVASDLPAFRQVLADGQAGVLTPVGDSAALAEALRRVLTTPAQRAELTVQGNRWVANFDWSTVADQVMRVYETAIAADPRKVTEVHIGTSA